MAKVEYSRREVPQAKRAIEYKNGDVLIDRNGTVALRTHKHILRPFEPNTLNVMDLSDSNDLFYPAPKGTVLIVTAE